MTLSQGHFCTVLHLFHSCDPDPTSKGKKQYGQHVFNNLQSYISSGNIDRCCLTSTI